MPEKTRTITDRILLFIKGVAMGAANKVPGVSGGMVAFVVGFYEEMIYSFQKINGKAFLLLVNGRFKSLYQYINGRFILILFAGSIFSYFSVSLLLDYLIRNYELFVWSTFFGMIIGSIYYIARGFHDWSTKNMIAIVIGITCGVAISFMNPAKENDNLWFVFFCGILGVSGMTLPGLSGSFILILMGNYVLLLVDSVNMLYRSITDAFSGNFEFLQDAERIRYLKIIGSFGAGSAFGLIVTSQILGYVLRRWHNIVTALIIGFISGSLGIVWPWKEKIFKKNELGAFLFDSQGNKVLLNYERYFPDLAIAQTWFAIFFILLGIVLILLIDYYAKRTGKKA
ncbi:MAG: DUF368 domain-containing protein [Flavobacteriaceae bacterium]|nr:DUF368 domain-containing protein [Flavobacteriaceae bacterium]